MRGEEKKKKKTKPKRPQVRKFEYSLIKLTNHNLYRHLKKFTIVQFVTSPYYTAGGPKKKITARALYKMV